MLSHYWLTTTISLLLVNVMTTFPGPRLTAITKYYRGYYEIFCDGGRLDQLEVLHEWYGPAVSLSKQGKYINSIDPNAYHNINVVERVPKDLTWYLTTLPAPGLVSILQLEELVQEKICHKIALVTIPLLDERQFIANRIDELAMSDRDTEEKRAIFDTFIGDYSDGLPRWKLIDEGAAFQMAATDMTVNATFHLLTNRGILLKLRKELDWINIEEDMKYEKLEHLPYLGAVIKESLRLSCGVSSPAPRRVRDKEVTIAVFILVKKQWLQAL
ncbi:hypothetical protein L218DRAFT_948076 [Marasmius fiardii PR-910]|nr:hypothetical protein L218DRAFT_948076 [Marasmius fiardii PR-910]